MRFLYNCSLHAFSLGIRLGALFNQKARQLSRGRQGLLRRIELAEDTARRESPAAQQSAIWVHCASLGEFEQGRPVIEALRARYPRGTADYRRIVVTFFSPSGYEIRHTYDQADAVYYLPGDTPGNARRFVEAVRPGVAIFVKYEYWYNYLRALRDFGSKSCVISAIFRPGAVFFRNNAPGRFMRQTLGLLDRFYVQNAVSRQLLESIGIGSDRVTISGDTRFDRVVALAAGAPELPLVETFARSEVRSAPEIGNVIVCGSTWPPDEELLLQLMSARPDLKFIIAPHEIDSARIDALIQRSGRVGVRYTRLSGEDPAVCTAEVREATLLVIDTIGILSGVYRYGSIAYIGGGFGRGIHNTLEAATWGMPILFGPKYQTFAEAVELVELGAAASVDDAAGLVATVGAWTGDPSVLGFKGAAAESYVRGRAGATQIILNTLGQ